MRPLPTAALAALLLAAFVAAPAAAQAAAGFTVYQNQSLASWGTVLADGNGYNATSFDVCLNDCALRPSGLCGAALYRRREKRCWLFSTIHTPGSANTNDVFASRSQPDIPSGTVVQGAASNDSAKVCRQNVTAGFDIGGWDVGTVGGVSYAGYVALDWKACQADCCALAPRQCTSWSYDLYARRCWLKTGRGNNPSPRTNYVYGVIPRPQVVQGVNVVYKSAGDARPNAGLGRRQVTTVNTTAGVAVSFNVTDMWNAATWTNNVLNSTYDGFYAPDHVSCMQTCANIENDLCGTFMYDQQDRKCTLRRNVQYFDQNTANNQTGNNNRWAWGYRLLPTMPVGRATTSPDPADPSKTLRCPTNVLDGIGLNDWDVPVINNVSYAGYFTATSLVCNADCCRLGASVCTGWNWDKQSRRCWLKRRGNWMESTDSMRNDTWFVTGIVPYPAITTGQQTSGNPAVTYGIVNNRYVTWGGNGINSTFENFFAVDWTACRDRCSSVGMQCGTWLYNKVDRRCWLRSSLHFAGSADTSWAWGSKVLPGPAVGLQTATATNDSSKTVQFNVTDRFAIDGWEFRSGYLANTWRDCQSDCAANWPSCTSYTYNKVTRWCQLRRGRADNARNDTDIMFGVVPSPPVVRGVSSTDYGNGLSCTMNVVEQLQPTWWGDDLRADRLGNLSQGHFAWDWTVCQANCCQLGPVCGSWFFNRYDRKCYYKSSASVASNNTDAWWTWGSKVAPLLVTGPQPISVQAVNSTATNTCPMNVPGYGYLDWNDISGYNNYISDTYRTCQADCCALWPQCNNWAYNLNSRRCWLKSQYGPFRNSTDNSTVYGFVETPKVVAGVSNVTSTCAVNLTDNMRMDWWGDDIRNEFFVSDHAACQAACCDLGDRCGSWAFRKSDRRCWTKQSATLGNNPAPDTNWMVATVIQPTYSNGTFAVPNNGTGTCAVTFQVGVSFWGNDIPGWSNYFVPKAGDCARDCCQIGLLCGSWSYDTRSRKCWLKNRYGDNANRDPNSISGIIPAPPIVTGQVTSAPSFARNGSLPPDGLNTTVGPGSHSFTVWNGFQSGWSWEINFYNDYFSATWRTCMVNSAFEIGSVRTLTTLPRPTAPVSAPCAASGSTGRARGAARCG
ncbi:hypothetical protein DFJ74DRAFT_693563 [Hyaloraphidium curvatum]|nr:hypothetical protein DFJ74DRAFT_693563 [Hyaloraphidium curvatum]